MDTEKARDDFDMAEVELGALPKHPKPHKHEDEPQTFGDPVPPPPPPPPPPPTPRDPEGRHG